MGDDATRAAGAQEGMPVADEDTATVDAAPTQPVEAPIGLTWLDPAEVEFSRSPGMVLRLALSDRCYRRVTVVRARPLSDPRRFLSVRDGDKEVGMLRELDELPPDQQELVAAELEHRYFRPLILDIRRLQDSHGSFLWDVDTDRGRAMFSTQSPRHSVTRLRGGGWLVTDVDNNRYEVRDLDGMSPRGRKLLQDLLG
ncbi:MAG: DUF1854 domain-containing protein [Armatimonadetes bacterium]|nr:DUF1854 domain-containing protein [Armatimonadota bacterium]